MSLSCLLSLEPQRRSRIGLLASSYTVEEIDYWAFTLRLVACNESRKSLSRCPTKLHAEIRILVLGMLWMDKSAKRASRCLSEIVDPRSCA